jgi:hypothetical protein
VAVTTGLRNARRAAALLLAAAAASGAGGETRGGEAVTARERMLHRLAGAHFTALLRLEIGAADWREQRVIRLWRDDRGAAHERVMLRFEAPPDLRGIAILYLENPDRPNDYFLYQPAYRRVRRLPEAMAREDVYGVDLEYLGFGGAQLVPTRLESEQRDTLDGGPVIRFTEVAREPNPRFERRVVWLDATNDVPLRMEHERDGEKVLVARTLDVASVHGVPTPRSMVFERLAEGTTVTVSVEQVDYRSPIPEEFFSTFQLVKEE